MCQGEFEIHTSEKKGLTLTKDVMNALYQLEGEKVFDFVFMDPPYNMGFEKRVRNTLQDRI